jgi:Protein of unknown function (DUF3102)
MPTSAPVNSFDYTSLDLDTASFVQQQTGEIRALMRRTAQDIFEIGQKLIEIKEKLGHGNFLAWLDTEFSWTERTARRFMSVAEQFADRVDMVSDLDFAPTALYTLASPSMSEEARSEAIERAQAGEFISAKKAQEIKQKYSNKTAKSTRQPKSATKTATIEETVELVEATIESPPGEETVQPTTNETVNEDEPVTEPEEVKALPPSPERFWWCLSGKHQKHLLFAGQHDEPDFVTQLPDRVGIWLAFPPTPDEWLLPPKGRVNTAFSYSTIYPNIDLKAVREAVERVLETSSESDLTAIVAYLPDPPLVVLLEDFQITCYIAEPDVAQCQKILSVWEQLGGEIEQLPTHRTQEISG